MDRNVLTYADGTVEIVSPPARVAWIETLCRGVGCAICRVATREGGVDRNTIRIIKRIEKTVVATREGGVDRNSQNMAVYQKIKESPPARVAWIETTLVIGSGQTANGRHPRGWRG